ncbi:MAG: hypothetical protein ABIQ89_03620 [Candidatus Saccharimonadales bacterium]
MPSKEFQALPTLAEFVAAEQNTNLFAVAALSAAILERATEHSAPTVSAVARTIKWAATSAMLINVAVDEWEKGAHILPQNDRLVAKPGAAILSYGDL